MHGSPCGLQLCMPTAGGSDELGYSRASHRDSADVTSGGKLSPRRPMVVSV